MEKTIYPNIKVTQTKQEDGSIITEFESYIPFKQKTQGILLNRVFLRTDVKGSENPLTMAEHVSTFNKICFSKMIADSIIKEERQLSEEGQESPLRQRFGNKLFGMSSSEYFKAPDTFSETDLFEISVYFKPSAGVK